jgi:hypothetical protein
MAECKDDECSADGSCLDCGKCGDHCACSGSDDS